MQSNSQLVMQKLLEVLIVQYERILIFPLIVKIFKSYT